MGTEELLGANDRFAEGFERGDLKAPPRKHLAVLTCMDARLHPERFLGLDVGDAHVIRNAGGRASDDALRSLAVSTHALGVTEIVVIHHTDCGMEGLDEQSLRQRTGSDIDFLGFDDLSESVGEDVRAIEGSPLLPDNVGVSGFVYDVRTGRLQPVR